VPSPTSHLPKLIAVARHVLTPALGRFLVVGVSNTALSFVVFWLCLWLLPRHPVQATVAQLVSYVAGIFWSFVWNRRWTFRSRAPAAGQAVRFTVLQVAVALVSSAQIGLAVDYLGLPVIPSWVAVLGFTTVVNFVGSRYWVFRDAEV
jgi:putative flippase GtrA